MTVKPITILPDPVLRGKSHAVTGINDETRRLMDDMVETMREANGLGLAAPQISVSKRVIVMECGEDEEEESPPIWKMANPEIIDTSPDTSFMNEGCLSIPGWRGEVTRPDWVKVRYLDYSGEVLEIKATGLLAACVQHEIDHLNGILFIDYLSRAKRDVIIRKFTKDARIENALAAKAS